MHPKASAKHFAFDIYYFQLLQMKHNNSLNIEKTPNGLAVQRKFENYTFYYCSSVIKNHNNNSSSLTTLINGQHQGPGFKTRIFVSCASPNQFLQSAIESLLHPKFPLSHIISIFMEAVAPPFDPLACSEADPVMACFCKYFEVLQDQKIVVPSQKQTALHTDSFIRPLKTYKKSFSNSRWKFTL